MHGSSAGQLNLFDGPAYLRRLDRNRLHVLTISELRKVRRARGLNVGDRLVAHEQTLVGDHGLAELPSRLTTAVASEANAGDGADALVGDAIDDHQLRVV